MAIGKDRKTRAKREQLKGRLKEKLNDNTDLIESIIHKAKRGRFNFNLDECDLVITEFLDSIIELTDEYDGLIVQEYLTIDAIEKGERIKQNPRTKEDVVVKPIRKPRITLGKKFTDIINRKNKQINT